jgi:plasmid stabilization system protein ParE
MALKIRITPPALDDLANIETYIKDECGNPTAAKRNVKKIMKSYLNLSSSPYTGFSVKGKYGIDTPFRALVSGRYVIIYEIDESANLVEILNVFHGKQNYIKTLFPDCDEVFDYEETKDM